MWSALVPPGYSRSADISIHRVTHPWTVLTGLIDTEFRTRKVYVSHMMAGADICRGIRSRAIESFSGVAVASDFPRVSETISSVILADLTDHDRSAVLELTAIRPDTRTFGGRPAPYQYLTLLWAIEKIAKGYPRLTPYKEAHDLRKILRDASPETRPDPIMPWFALFNRVPSWWEIERPKTISGQVFQRSDIRKYNLRAGIPAPRYERLRTDTQFRQKVVEFIKPYIDESLDN